VPGSRRPADGRAEQRKGRGEGLGRPDARQVWAADINRPAVDQHAVRASCVEAEAARAGGRDGALIGKRAAVPGARNPEGIETRYAHHSLIEPRAVVDHADRAGRRAQDRTGQQRIRSIGPKTSFL